jgi:hypothetical protein
MLTIIVNFIEKICFFSIFNRFRQSLILILSEDFYSDNHEDIPDLVSDRYLFFMIITGYWQNFSYWQNSFNFQLKRKAKNGIDATHNLKS